MGNNVVIYYPNEARETAEFAVGSFAQDDDFVYEYVRFESNVSADNLVAITGAGVASNATNTSVGRAGVCTYSVTASTASPRFGWVVVKGRVRVNASGGAANGLVYATGTAGEVNGTASGNRIVRGAFFATAASGGKADVNLNFSYLDS